MGKLGTTFTYNERYLEAVNEIQDEQLRYRLNYDLCYYGVYGELPPDAGDVSKLFITSVRALIEGSHEYNAAQSVKGKKGGRTSAVSDEQIKGAIIEFYGGHGRLPSNTELGAMVGLTGDAVRHREPWKNKDVIISENCEECEQYDTHGF